jgi:hypothetical protein
VSWIQYVPAVAPGQFRGFLVFCTQTARFVEANFCAGLLWISWDLSRLSTADAELPSAEEQCRYSCLDPTSMFLFGLAKGGSRDCHPFCVLVGFSRVCSHRHQIDSGHSPESRTTCERQQDQRAALRCTGEDHPHGPPSLGQLVNPIAILSSSGRNDQTPSKAVYGLAAQIHPLLRVDVGQLLHRENLDQSFPFSSLAPIGRGICSSPWYLTPSAGPVRVFHSPKAPKPSVHFLFVYITTLPAKYARSPFAPTFCTQAQSSSSQYLSCSRLRSPTLIKVQLILSLHQYLNHTSSKLIFKPTSHQSTCVSNSPPPLLRSSLDPRSPSPSVRVSRQRKRVC